MVIGMDASRALRAARTGTERYALEIISHLLTLPEAADHGWRLYTDGPGGETLIPPECRADVQVVMLPPVRAWTHRALAREIRQRPPDLLFVPAHVIPLRLPRQLPPSVVTIHDVGYRHFPESHTWRQRLYLDLSTRWSVHAAAQVIAVSRATARDLSRAYGTPAAKVTVIHEALPRHAPGASAHEVRAIYGLERPYGLFVGTIQPRKNVARLITAYATLRARQASQWDLVLAGRPGWLSTPIRRLVDDLALAGHVRFLDYVPDAHLMGLYQGARLFCFPSLFEGFGLPVLEAQQQGVPVMTANNSALPEVAGDGALLVDPTDVEAMADAMLRLSEDEALRRQLIQAGYANVRRFSWEAAARETLDVLLAAAGQGR